jgi:colanic acid/amylovoran biosynthesis glycosyltransferase
VYFGEETQRMKIAFIVTEFPALSETFILNQIIGLLQAGHDVQIFAHTGDPHSKVHPEVTAFDVLDRTHYFPALPDSRAKRVIKAAALVFLHIGKNPRAVAAALRYSMRCRNVRMLYALVPFLGKSFDIIHCHFGPNGVLGVTLRELGVTGMIITSFHGYDVNSYPLAEGSGVYDNLFKRGDRFTANTLFTKKQVEQLGCPADKIEIIHESLDIEKFPFCEKKLTDHERVYLLTIGRLVKKKGHRYALAALARVVKKFPNITYTIAGDGPLRNELEQETVNLGLERQVVFQGAVDADEAQRLYARSHLFMLPSITTENLDREGQALVLQEAQACGLPVLSTLHNGIPEGVCDGESGFLVPEKDVETLVERLEYLVTHPECWAPMGRRGRQLVEKKFDRTRVNQALISMYHNTLSRKGKS